MRSGENDGVFAGACGDGGGEGISNGDGVAAVTAIDRYSCVAAFSVGVIVCEGDGVIAEAADGCCRCMAIIKV